MHYFALYRREFTGMPRPLRVGSHALVGSVTAEDLDEAFYRLQGESMCGVLAEQIAANLQVRHTSASVGDILVNAEGIAFMVDLTGFSFLRLETTSARAEYALHLMSMQLEGSPGWEALFAEDATATAALLSERLRHDTLGLVYQARHPFTAD